MADDVRLEAEAAQRALADSYEVELFSDGSTVIERAASGALPDLLVLDWHMSGMSGIDVCEFFRSEERTVSLPILVFTATGEEQDLLQALAAGADDYVSKDASDAELHARVGALLRSKHLLDRAETAERAVGAMLLREREARKEADAANRAKDLFLATVSHELRTPLNAILGWAGLLQQGLQPAQHARAVETIERNARAQARIIDDLLDLSRIVTGKLRLELLPIDAAVEVAGVVETQRPAATSKRIELKAMIDRDMAIAADTSRVQQMASNLLANAIKFTPSGGHVQVTLTRERDEIVLRVSDDGAGISPELLPRVFDRFRQGDSTSTRSHAGLGLGLAIVRELTELHHARVAAISAGPGQGATFEIAFPALPGIGDAPARARTPTPSDVRHVRVLLVDDDRDGREVVSELLCSAGADVRTAGSADEALATLQRWTPDVLVSDIAMPERDGLELMRAVLERSAPRPAAIALTAHVREEDRSRTKEAGFHAHLAKPVDVPELLRTIARLAPCTREQGD